LRSNAYVIKNNLAMFRNSIPDFKYDIQPLYSKLFLAFDNDALNGVYNVIEASTNTFVINIDITSTNEILKFLRDMFCDKKGEALINFVSSDQLITKYSQNVRVYQF